MITKERVKKDIIAYLERSSNMNTACELFVEILYEYPEVGEEDSEDHWKNYYALTDMVNIAVCSQDFFSIHLPCDEHALYGLRKWLKEYKQ